MITGYQALNKFTFFTYDNAGNITLKRKYTFTDRQESIKNSTLISSKSYTYNNGKLVKHTDIGNISYDEIGNPISYGYANLTWSHVNRLRTYTKGSLKCSYDYNYAGIRIKRTVDKESVTKFAVEGDKIIAQENPVCKLRFTMLGEL